MTKLMTTAALAACLLVPVYHAMAAYWTKPGASAEEFYQVNYECQREAANHPIWLGNGMSVPNNQLAVACLNAHGWFLK
jgi:hypothetical protein